MPAIIFLMGKLHAKGYAFRLMQPEVTQYLMRATAELAELLGIAV